MSFILSDTLMHDVAVAMEDAQSDYCVKVQDGVATLSKCETDFDSKNTQGSEYYATPTWSSEEGFLLREDWVKLLYPSKLKRQLQKALHGGRGAFKAFKDTLAPYPQAKKLWETHKARALQKAINEWYNALRDQWGMERLAQKEDCEEADTFEALLSEDFTFEKSDPKNSAELEKLLSTVDCTNKITGEWLWYAKNRGADECFKAKTASGECVGFAIVKGELVTALFVREEYRGIGIGTKLLQMCAPHKTCLCFKCSKKIGDYNDDYEECED